MLGIGRAKCNQLEAATKAALEQLGMDTAITHVTDFSQIAAYGVMTIPALVIRRKGCFFHMLLKSEDAVDFLWKIR